MPCAAAGARGSPRAGCQHCPGSTTCSPGVLGASLLPPGLRWPSVPCGSASPARPRGALRPCAPKTPGSSCAPCAAGPCPGTWLRERRWPWGALGAGEGQALGFGVGLAGGRRGGGACFRNCWPQPGSGAAPGVGGQLARGLREAWGLPDGVGEMSTAPGTHGASSHPRWRWAAWPGHSSHGGSTSGTAAMARARRRGGGGAGPGGEQPLSPGSSFSHCGGGCDTPCHQKATKRLSAVAPGSRLAPAAGCAGRDAAGPWSM